MCQKRWHPVAYFPCVKQACSVEHRRSLKSARVFKGSRPLWWSACTRLPHQLSLPPLTPCATPSHLGRLRACGRPPSSPCCCCCCPAPPLLSQPNLRLPAEAPPLRKPAPMPNETRASCSLAFMTPGLAQLTTYRGYASRQTKQTVFAEGLQRNTKFHSISVRVCSRCIRA